MSPEPPPARKGRPAPRRQADRPLARGRQAPCSSATVLEELTADRWSLPRRLSAIAAGRTGTRWTVALAALAAIAIVMIAENAAPHLTSLGSLILVAVLGAAWLLEGPPLVAVATAALASRLVAMAIGGLDAGTAVAESVAILLIATSARTAAVATARTLAAERRETEHRLQLARLDERERIASEVRSTAVRRLFGVTLSLEAELESQPGEVSPRLRSAVSELDQVCSELRTTIFRGERAPNGSAEPSSR